MGVWCGSREAVLMEVEREWGDERDFSVRMRVCVEVLSRMGRKSGDGESAERVVEDKNGRGKKMG
ncbi:hypothetical protein COLO4_33071 [Corchorus olitorius]|uniref:Uncharacterized protein n=1 Tax=Corchorus olitorius TaxID=93759 RepID=A0A1R3GWI8_9ROSI|nr:hypothetical protein COLO4_33071 [Corchorus olitorius]